MATAESKFECSLCLEKFKDPRILSCFHTYCRDCLGDYVTKSKRVENSVEKFDCPVCRASVTLPANGVDGLQKNFYLDQNTNKSSHPMCAVHKNEDLRFYCRECRERICRDCKIVSHEGHATGMAEDVATEMRKELEELFTDTEKSINENEIRQRAVVETDLGSLETTLAVVEINTGMMKNEIERLFVFTKNLLSPHIKSKKKRACIIEKAYADKLSELNGHKLMLTEADSKGSRDIFQTHKDLMDKENEIMELEETPLYLDSEKSDEGGLDNSKIMNMFDQLRDNLRQETTKFKSTDFTSNGSSKSTSTKRMSSPEEDPIELISLKKRKETDVTDTDKKEVLGGSHGEVPTTTKSDQPMCSSKVKRSCCDSFFLDSIRNVDDLTIETALRNKGSATSAPSSSTDSKTKSSGGANSLFANLSRVPISVKPTHEVKPVINQSTDVLAKIAATRSTTNVLAKIAAARSTLAGFTGESQGQYVKFNASNSVNTGTSVDGVAGGPRRVTTPVQASASRAGADNKIRTIEGSRVELKGGGTFLEGEVYLVRSKTGQEKKMIFKAGQLIEEPVIMNTTDNAYAVLERAQVELKGGRTFEKSQMYIVRSKTGQEKKMIWTGKQLVELRSQIYDRRKGHTAVKWEIPGLSTKQIKQEETKPGPSGDSNQRASGTAAEVSAPASASQLPVNPQIVETRSASATPDVVRTVRSDLHLSFSSDSD